MKKKLLAIIAVILVLSLSLCGCGDKKESKALTMGTGGETGTYYAVGGVLAQYISSKTDLSVTAVSSSASQANIEDMDAGDIDLAFVQSDVMTYAYNGTSLFDKSITSFSVIAALYMEQVQIVTLDPNIKTVEDLKGKTVSIGASGSGTYFNALDVLGVYGMTEADIKPVYQSFGDSVESLQDKKIDAAFIVAGVPTNAVASLAATNDVYLVGLDDEHTEKLVSISPYYSAYTVSKDVYNTPEDVNTVAIAAVLIASNDLDEDTVYKITSNIYDNLDALTAQHAKIGEFSTEFAASITSVPYHAGAAKYFAEKGFNVG